MKSFLIIFVTSAYSCFSFGSLFDQLNQIWNYGQGGDAILEFAKEEVQVLGARCVEPNSDNMIAAYLTLKKENSPVSNVALGHFGYLEYCPGSAPDFYDPVMLPNLSYGKETACFGAFGSFSILRQAKSPSISFIDKNLYYMAQYSGVDGRLFSTVYHDSNGKNWLIMKYRGSNSFVYDVDGKKREVPLNCYAYIKSGSNSPNIHSLSAPELPVRSNDQ